MKIDFRAVLLTSVMAIILLSVCHAYQPQATVIDFRLEEGDPHFIKYEGKIVDEGEYWYMNVNTETTAQILFGIPEKKGIDAVLVFTFSKDDPDSVGRDIFTLLASSGGEYDAIWSAPEWGHVNKTAYIYIPPEYIYFRFLLSDGRNSYEYLKLNKDMQVMLFTNQTPTTTTVAPSPTPPTPPPLIDITQFLNQDFFMILTFVATVVSAFLAYKIIKRGQKKVRGKGIKFEKYG